MSVPIVVVGAGGFGRETLDVIAAINATQDSPQFAVVGVIDRGPSDVNLARIAARGLSWLGTEDDWLATDTDAVYAIGIGDGRIRQQVADRFDRAGRTPATLVHPQAVVGSQASIGAGSIVCGGVQVSTNVSVGRHVHLNPNATIGHDSWISDWASVNPGAIVSGDVRVGERSLIGAGAVVLQGLNVGADSRVGAAACVVRDVPSGATVKGVPAR